MAQKKPLTLKELLEMDGKPAYWAEDESYGIISVDNWGRWEGIPFFNGRKNGADFKYDIQARKMKVYAVEPHRLDREAWEKCDVCKRADGAITATYSTEDMQGFTITNHRLQAKYCPECGRPLTDEAWKMLEKRIEN